MNVNFYKDVTGDFSGVMGSVVMLCKDHALETREEGTPVKFVQPGDEFCACEYPGCSRSNSSRGRAEMLAVVESAWGDYDE